MISDGQRHLELPGQRQRQGAAAAEMGMDQARLQRAKIGPPRHHAELFEERAFNRTHGAVVAEPQRRGVQLRCVRLDMAADPDRRKPVNPA